MTGYTFKVTLWGHTSVTIEGSTEHNIHLTEHCLGGEGPGLPYCAALENKSLLYRESRSARAWTSESQTFNCWSRQAARELNEGLGATAL
eukprot:5139115-Amphidinium_carterae.1